MSSSKNSFFRRKNFRSRDFCSRNASKFESRKIFDAGVVVVGGDGLVAVAVVAVVVISGIYVFVFLMLGLESPMVLVV